MDVPTGPSGPSTPPFWTIAFRSSEGLEVSAVPCHLGRHEVSFEIPTLDGAIRTSEVLPEFSVRMGERIGYKGRATATATAISGSRTVCSVALEDAWIDAGLNGSLGATPQRAFDCFWEHWQKQARVKPEFKVVVADMQSLLVDLELWLAQVEMGFEDLAGDELNERRTKSAREFAERTLPALNDLFEKFESISNEASAQSRPAYRVFARRQLHPWLLCSPFLHRTYRKPLGYAGDYEMVKMISRDPYEGATIFAKVINCWFLAQPPAQAHRNRLEFLERRISEVAVRAASERRPARVLNLGCGPALEIEDFLRKHEWADRVEFTLIDFNQETLERTGASLRSVCHQHRRSTSIDLIRKSVVTLLREGQNLDRRSQAGFDLVYCAGLFDYLTEPVSRRLSTLLYDWLRPGGHFLTTNVHQSNPWPLVMDFIMDWHLIYRGSVQMLATRPEQLSPEECRLTTDSTGVNLFLEATKI